MDGLDFFLDNGYKNPASTSRDVHSQLLQFLDIKRKSKPLSLTTNRWINCTFTKNVVQFFLQQTTLLLAVITCCKDGYVVQVYRL